jgi:hypothetical protein
MIDSNCGGNATNRPCNIHLRIHKVKDQVHFIVEVGSDLDAPKQDISIDNNVLVPLCKERLQRLYHLRHEFFVKRSDDGNGVIVEMHIPFHTQPIKYSSTLLEETFK